MSRVRVWWAAAALILLPPSLGAQDMMLPVVDRPLSVERETLFQVGAMEGEAWETFGSIDGAAFDADGNLYILDGQNVRVVVLDATGGHVRSFGRSGAGPGEFQMPGGLAVTPGDRVIVYDAARGNYSILDATGEYIGSVPTDMFALAARPSGGNAMGARVVGHPSGGFLVEHRGIDIDTGDPETSSDNGGRLPVILYPASDGSAGEELFAGDYAGPAATLVARPGEQSMQMGAPPAFAPVFRWGVLPDGDVAYMDGIEYAVHLLGSDGESQGTLRRPIEPRGVTSRDESMERERRLEALESTGAGAPVRVEVVNGVRRQSSDLDLGRELIEQLAFAETMPVLANLAVDREGRIWVQRMGPRPGEPGPVDVMTASGDYLGTTAMESLPYAFGPDGLAVWVETGDLGIQQVRVERVVVAGM